MDITVELDTNEVWEEIEDQVVCAAQEAAGEAIENADFDHDYAQGAEDLLNSYTPGGGCQLARLFEDAVQGAVQTGDFLKDVVLEQIGEHTAGNVDDIGKIRAIVREEIRLAVTAVISELTKAPPSVV